MVKKKAKKIKYTGSSLDKTRKSKRSGYRFKTDDLLNSRSKAKQKLGEKLYYRAPTASDRKDPKLASRIYYENRFDKTHSDDDLRVRLAKGGTVTPYMGNPYDEVVVEKSGKGERALYLLTNAKTFSLIDMFFSSKKEAKKYADKKNLIVVDDFHAEHAEGGVVDTQIATTILHQLGGAGRLKMMTGARDFVALPRGVAFRLPNPKANHVQIILNAMDTYDLVVSRIRAGKTTVVVEESGLYDDMLKKAVEKATGLYLSLAEGGNVSEELRDFDLGNLNMMEEMQYEHFSKSMTKEEALQVLINNVEEDYTQLNPELEKIAEKQHPTVYADGGKVPDSWGSTYSDTNSTDKDYDELYELFPDKWSEAHEFWGRLSQKQKDGFTNMLSETDAAGEHLSESWLEFVDAPSEEYFWENAKNWDEEDYEKGGKVDGINKRIEELENINTEAASSKIAKLLKAKAAIQAKELHDEDELTGEREGERKAGMDENYASGGSVGKKNWIQGAIKHKGALRKTALRKGLLRNKDEKLSMTDLNKLEKVGGKTGQRARLAETLRKFEEGGSVGGVLEVNPSFKYKNIIERWLNDNPPNKLKYQLSVALLKGERDPDERFEIPEDRYDRLLRSLEKIGAESPNEMSWRTRNFTTAKAEGWAKEALNKFFVLKK